MSRVKWAETGERERGWRVVRRMRARREREREWRDGIVGRGVEGGGLRFGCGFVGLWFVVCVSGFCVLCLVFCGFGD